MRAAAWARAVATIVAVAVGVGATTVALPTAPAGAVVVPLPWLVTVGNRVVVAGSGQDVVLRGANVLRSEWDLRMDAERRAIPVLAQQWKGNVIVRGFASDPVNGGDARYLAMLDEHVSLAAANRMYVVFAWRSHGVNGQQPTMPDDRAQQALATLARRYHGVSNVIYALQVEPHDVAWSTLQPRFERMVDAIRTAAAPHEPIVMVPGTGWGRDVSGAITQPVRRDNVVYKSNPYNSSWLFQQQFLDTYQAGMPVFLGEFGYLPEHGMHMADVHKAMDVAAWHGLGWAAWAFDAQGGPALVTDNTTFNPTTPYGAAVQTDMRRTPPVLTPTAAPVPVVAPPPASVTIVNDSVTGMGPGAFSYSSGWSTATGSPTKHGGDDHYTGTRGATATFRFSGTRTTLVGSRAPWHGAAAISVDGGPEQVVDWYGPTRQDQVALFTTAVLPRGGHVVRVRVLGLRNGYSTGDIVTVDRADVTA